MATSRRARGPSQSNKRETDYEAALEQAKRASPGQLLMRAARLMNEEGIARIRANGRPDVRVSHTSLLPHIDLEGTRITELARRMGVTKQAVNQSVTELEQLGILLWAEIFTQSKFLWWNCIQRALQSTFGF